MMPADVALLERDAWFGSLPPVRRQLLCSLAQSRSVQSHHCLYAQGDDPDGLWAVLDGQVRLIAYPSPGLELLALLIGPGNWFGELSTIDGGPRPHDAIAFGPTRVLHIRMAQFVRAAADEPRLYHDLALLSCSHQRASLAFIAEAVSQPLRVRLARLLLQTFRNTGSLSLEIRQAEIANVLGVSRQTLNKTLRHLANDRVIVSSYAKIIIYDPVALELMAR